MTQKKKHDDFEVFRPPRFQRIGTVLGLGFIAIIMLGIVVLMASTPSSDYNPTAYRLLLMVSFSLGALGMVYWAYHTVVNDCLIITPDGLQFVILGTSGFAEWDNVVRLDNRGIHLAQPITVRHNTLARLLYMGRAYQCIPINYVIPIPQGLRKIKLQEFTETDFGRELYHYVPHLFDGVDDKAKRLWSEEVPLDEENYLTEDKLESRRR